MTPSETLRTLSGLNPATGGTGIRNLQLQSGDPASLLGNTTNASQGLGTTSRLSSGAYQRFLTQVMDLLRQNQQLNISSSEKFGEENLRLQEEQVKRTMEPSTPGMSPAQQATIRQASIGAITPSISGIESRAKTFSGQLQSFENILKYAKDFGGELAKISPSPEILEGYRQMIIAGGNPSTIPDEVRNQVIGKLTTDDWNSWVEANKKSTADSLTLYQQTQVEQNKQAKAQTIAGQFDNEAIVKQYNTIAEAVGFINSLGNLPTDDIGRIYQFAKIMDPTSSVREGEYKTVQDYATTLLQKYGLNAKRVFTNTGFLTQQARDFLNTTLNSRLQASQKNYNNVYNEYVKRIDNALGEIGKGKEYITNYAGGYTPQTGGLREQVISKGYDYDSMKNKGYSDEEIKQSLGL